MNRLLNLPVGAALLLRAIPVFAADEVFPVVHNEPIAVRVADGKDGKPLPHEHVVLVAGYDRSDLDLALWREEAVTDAEGEVRLSNALRNLPVLRVEVLKRHICAPGAGDAAFSLERIRLDGLSSANRCGAITLADAPGVLTVFVKGMKGGAPAAGVFAQPIAVAVVPASAPAGVAVPASVVVPSSQANASSASVPSNRREVGQEVEPETGPAAETVLPPIPFALPAGAYPMADSAPVAVSVPSAPRVVSRGQSARPSPEPKASSGIDSASASGSAAKPAPGGRAARPPSQDAVHSPAALRRTAALERRHKQVPGEEDKASPSVRRAAKPAPPSTSRTDHLSAPAKPSAAHPREPDFGRVIAPRVRAGAAPPANPASIAVPVSARGVVSAPQPSPPPNASPASAVSPVDLREEDGVDPMCAPAAGQS